MMLGGICLVVRLWLNFRSFLNDTETGGTGSRQSGNVLGIYIGFLRCVLIGIGKCNNWAVKGFGCHGGQLSEISMEVDR